MERGSNTSWILDSSENLRLAHEDQLVLIPSPSVTSPLQSPLQCDESDCSDSHRSLDAQTKDTEPDRTETEPSSLPEPRRWPTRVRKKKTVLDYNDL